jgi:GTPase
MSLTKSQIKLPIVALIGRTNVGKSTLFNRLTEEKGAIVSEIEGTTRDRKYGQVWWLGRDFLLVDTAGLDVSTEAAIDKESIIQAKKAVAEADLILLVVDSRAGLQAEDREYAKMIRRWQKPTLVVANKVDSNRQLKAANNFNKLGFGDPLAVSATTGAGTGDLLDEVAKVLKNKIKDIETKPEFPIIKLAIIGKPNVGKSSLLNKIAGEERVIVSDIPHTTRDSQAVDIDIENEGQKYQLRFIDTAGIRKKRKIDFSIEEASVEQSVENIKRADIVLFVIDAGKGVSIQDGHIAREIMENNKSLIIVVNKWDLVLDKTPKSAKDFLAYLDGELPFLAWAPKVFVSAKTGTKVDTIVKTIFEVYANQNKEISDKELEHFLQYAIKHQTPKRACGRRAPFLLTLKQINKNPQTFELVADQPHNIHFSYMRYLINLLREKFGLVGVGVKLTIKFPKRKSHTSNR